MFKFLRKYPRRAIWSNASYDKEVTVTGRLGVVNGEIYYSIEGSNTGIPGSQIKFLKR